VRGRKYQAERTKPLHGIDPMTTTIDALEPHRCLAAGAVGPVRLDRLYEHVADSSHRDRTGKAQANLA